MHSSYKNECSAMRLLGVVLKGLPRHMHLQITEPCAGSFVGVAQKRPLAADISFPKNARTKR